MQIGDKGESNVDVFMHEHVSRQYAHLSIDRRRPAPRFLSTLQVLVRGCFLEVAGDRGKGRGRVRSDTEEREEHREKIEEER
ncbi:hypothetical protein G5I_00150 [Acromyrmex echinatior]|uniref:Uncharacterized protein n=1 Tax=Acromyrmex echinatior TaxID=103372 RepID=F4W445_ACREC|nr:hypothetical protein G5I_00150 [Acromyrmex echinatior]